MFLLGSIHQNVFTCPKSVMLHQMDQFLWKAVSAFSNRSAIYERPNKKDFNFPGSQYLLLTLSLGTVWMRRGLCNENIVIRCPPSFWKCPSPFVVLWTWWKFLSDMLVILLIHISPPIYFSLVCLGAWLTESCSKHWEAHNKLFRSCHSSSCCETYGTTFVPFSTRYIPALFCAFWSEILFSRASLQVSLSRSTLCLSSVGGRSGTGLQCFFFKLTEVIPPVAFSFSVNPSNEEAYMLARVEGKFSG